MAANLMPPIQYAAAYIGACMVLVTVLLNTSQRAPIVQFGLAIGGPCLVIGNCIGTGAPPATWVPIAVALGVILAASMDASTKLRARLMYRSKDEIPVVPNWANGGPGTE